MGWNDYIDVSDIEQEILLEWYPDYLGDAYEHPDYARIYDEALNRWTQKYVMLKEADNDNKENR